jgi:hypothetical protein
VEKESYKSEATPSLQKAKLQDSIRIRIIKINKKPTGELIQ